MTDDEIRKLVEAHGPMTKEEREAQRQSYARSCATRGPRQCVVVTPDAWTREPPRVAGLYWYRDSPGSKPWAVELRPDSRGDLKAYREERKDLAGYEGEWAGPLTPPP